MEKRRAPEWNVQNNIACVSVCIHALRYIRRISRRVYLSDERRFLHIIYTSYRRLLQAFAHPRVFRTTVCPFFLCLSYPSPLRPESCSCEFLHECKRRPGRLYELFQFTSTNCRSFLRFLSFLSLSVSLSLSLPFSFPLFPFLSFPCT